QACSDDERDQRQSAVRDPEQRAACDRGQFVFLVSRAAAAVFGTSYPSGHWRNRWAAIPIAASAWHASCIPDSDRPVGFPTPAAVNPFGHVVTLNCGATGVSTAPKGGLAGSWAQQRKGWQ